MLLVGNRQRIARIGDNRQPAGDTFRIGSTFTILTTDSWLSTSKMARYRVAGSVIGRFDEREDIGEVRQVRQGRIEQVGRTRRSSASRWSRSWQQNQYLSGRLIWGPPL